MQKAEICLYSISRLLAFVFVAKLLFKPGQVSVLVVQKIDLVKIFFKVVEEDWNLQVESNGILCKKGKSVIKITN